MSETESAYFDESWRTATEFKPPAWGVEPDPEVPEKFEQRIQARDALKNHDTILELYAGRGFLTERVYKGHGKLLVLVDDEQKLLKQAKEKIRGCKAHLYYMDNMKFLDRYVRRYPEITLVDFDAYGSPAFQIQKFFARHPVRQRIVVSITDGMITGWPVLGKDWEGRYFVHPKKKPMKEDLPDFMDSLMKTMSKQHHFNFEKINGVWKEGAAIYYCGYLISPPEDSTSKGEKIERSRD